MSYTYNELVPIQSIAFTRSTSNIQLLTHTHTPFCIDSHLNAKAVAKHCVINPFSNLMLGTKNYYCRGHGIRTCIPRFVTAHAILMHSPICQSKIFSRLYMRENVSRRKIGALVLMAGMPAIFNQC